MQPWTRPFTRSQRKTLHCHPPHGRNAPNRRLPQAQHQAPRRPRSGAGGRQLALSPATAGCFESSWWGPRCAAARITREFAMPTKPPPAPMAWRNIEIDQLISRQSLVHTEFARALPDDHARGLGERVRADHTTDTPIADGVRSSSDAGQDPLRTAAVRLGYRLVRRLTTGSWGSKS